MIFTFTDVAGTEVAMARPMKNDSPDTKLTKPARAARPRAPKKVVQPSPTAADIARRAYEIYLSRKGAPGDPESDWLQAEAELKDGGGRR